MTGNAIRVFADITKVNDEQRMVYGYASTTSLDSQNERISKSALEKALPDYMRFANIREMHQNSAVGTAEEATIDDKGLYLCAHVVDDNAWKKVKAGVYKGFSIGGKSLSKVNDEITSLRLSEISLVDRPANPECVIDLYKSEDSNNGSENMEEQIEKVAARSDVNPKEGNEKYGNVEFADAKNKKYPIDTAAHIRAAWNYINKENNASKYSAADVAAIKKKIVAAWKAKIDKNGPPSASQKADSSATIKKGMWEVAQLASLLQQLDALQDCLAQEAFNEGDNSPLPAQLQENVESLGATLRALVAEETQEMADDTDDDEDDGDDEGESDGYTEVEMSDKVDDVSKAGARHSAADMEKVQGMHDMSVALGASCSGDDSEDGEDEEDSEKSAHAHDIKKMNELNDLVKSLQDDNETLKKKIEELSKTVVPAKGVLKAVAVSKEQDKGTIEKSEEEPKTPADAIKKAHQSGPSFVIGAR